MLQSLIDAAIKAGLIQLGRKAMQSIELRETRKNMQSPETQTTSRKMGSITNKSESDTITMDMEDGSHEDFAVLGTIENEGRKYIALAKVDSLEYEIMEMCMVGEYARLSVIEDNEEFEEIAAMFDKKFSQAQE
jgi:uncharacterized protein YrzB (UPF0473 family)